LPGATTSSATTRVTVTRGSSPPPRDLAKDPTRPGSVERPELGDNVRSWHLRGSRYTAGDVVRRPRHFLIYRVEDDILVIGRVLHDTMELRRHVAVDRSWQ
jgi:toxin ParE1/3/4